MKKKTLLAVSGGLLLLLLAVGGYFYVLLMAPNINTHVRHYPAFYVYPGQTWAQVMDGLQAADLLENRARLEQALRWVGEDKQPQCGKYILEPGIGNRGFINRLGYGMEHRQEVCVKMTRTPEWVARNLSRQLMVDSATIANQLLSKQNLNRYGLTQNNALAMFVRGKFALSWCASVEELSETLYVQYQNFWTPERRQAAVETGLSLPQIHTLASIVEEETNVYEDKRMVAGVYMNRLHRGMALQSCPTVRFAVGDFTLHRILKVHLATESPYNTYKYAGLPPGPIRIPSEESIEAVLHYAHHSYLYMCAKADFSGTHDYSMTYQEHSRRARAYQRVLNQRGIRK